MEDAEQAYHSAPEKLQESERGGKPRAMPSATCKAYGSIDTPWTTTRRRSTVVKQVKRNSVGLYDTGRKTPHRKEKVNSSCFREDPDHE